MATTLEVWFWIPSANMREVYWTINMSKYVKRKKTLCKMKKLKKIHIKFKKC